MAARWFCLILLFCAAPAGAGELVRSGAGTVVKVVDGDTLFLDDGVEVRLVGIQAPKLPLGRRDFQAWPLAEEAKRALEELSLGRRVELSYGGRRGDRYGRALAHLHRSDGLWLQQELLRQGMARVYSFRDNRAVVAELLAAERQARAAARGIWGNPWYRVRTVAETPRHIGSFQLVEGRVLAVAVVRGRLYLNFGEDWRSDFTVSAAPRDRRLFDKAGFDYRGLARRLIRVRGWLKSYNGPLIEVTHPEQIEVFE
ncbi:MAG: thermonuclease family protein [Alphaproteobacteria bacterium]|jgi:endonuclease YncB( thermonuclease family)|nr:thermonuclease family protein [Alphaproteobacteria bacterium]